MSTPDLLTTHEVRRRFGRLDAVDGVSITLPAGARRALIGPNGAGKTTLLNLLAGALKPTGGRIHFDGRDVTRLGSVRRARRGIGRTHQHPAVWPTLSAMDNVAVVTGRGSGTREMLEKVGLADAAKTVAGSLAHGQRRQLELAIALAGRPRLLLLDEPAAGLTPSEVDTLASLLAALPDTVSVLLVEHHLDLVYAFADSVTVLQAGREVLTGTPAEIRASDAVAAAYAGVRP
jgi:branched-chain amino acid transport system ATP-binding protein